MNGPPFDAKEFLARVGHGRTLAKYDKGQRIYGQGDAADAVFYILEGKLKVSIGSSSGKDAVVAFLGKDEFTGEGCLAGQSLRSSSATAITDCEVMRLERDTIAKALRDEPTFSALFVFHILTRNVRLEADLADQICNSSERRLARLLLLLANHGRGGPPEPMVGSISQETLADMIGTTRSRVSFFMNKFRRQGFISYNGKIEVYASLSSALDDIPNVRRKAP